MIAARPLENSTVRKSEKALIPALCALLLLVGAVYSNHFQNAFHFDDTHAIVENPYIQNLQNIPLFFKDGSTSSTLPSNRTYRPLVTASLALDYRLGHGLQPLWFHISTFFWFLVQIVLMFVLFRAILERVRPGGAPWVAFFATAIYAVHPVMAETVNYVVQRADLYSTLGVIAGLALYAQFPKLRRTGIYLLPVLAGLLSKAPAAVFPALLFLYLWLFEEESFWPAFVRSIPAFAVIGAGALFVARMTPSSYVAGVLSPLLYRATQPAVLMGYFRKFFLPLDLSADTDRVPVTSLFSVDAIGGFLFIAALIAAAWWCTRKKELRPVAFGIGWFLVASLPTSWIALSEVENDHRMYLPFAGVTLSVCWTVALLAEKRLSAKLLAPACALIVAGFAWGAHERNKVWKTDESLWYDVTQKSPHNGRGLMNYGLSQMERGRNEVALDYFLRAAQYNPDYYVLEINLGIVYSTLANAAAAEKHFTRAIALAPLEAWPRYFYARWLAGTNRRDEALAQLETGVRQNPDYLPARYLLMQVYADNGDQANLTRVARETTARFPSDAAANSWLARAPGIRKQLPPLAPANVPADAFVAQSLAFYRAAKYPESIKAAQQALKLKPDYAEAWNNIGAAYNQMGQWDNAIKAEANAIRLKPDLQIAKNNLTVALNAKKVAVAAH